MKRLPRTDFLFAEKFINTEARQLEKALYRHYFAEDEENGLVEAIGAYQNDDGGFGRGIEPDFRLAVSSPMATSVGLRYLMLADENETVRYMISRAVRYLEQTFDHGRKGWFSVSKEVNDVPHAPWWTFRDEEGMTVIDYSWGNPTAELIGYLYKYREYLEKIDIDGLVDEAVSRLIAMKGFESEHEIYCYVRMYNLMDSNIKSRMEESLNKAVETLVETDESRWVDYVPTPLHFVEMESENYFGLKFNDINKNLDHIIDRMEREPMIVPNWSWDAYPEEWKQAEKEWTGVLTLEALLKLKKFMRL